MEDWDGVERRTRCEVHEDMMASSIKNGLAIETIQKSIDEMHKDIQDNGKAVREVERIVSNGLSHRVKEIHEQIGKIGITVEQIRDNHEQRIAELEEFGWFRKTVTEWRDNMFKTGFKVFLFIFAVIVLANFADKTIVQAFIKMLGM